MIATGYTIAACVNSSAEESEQPIYSLSLYSYPKLPVHTSESEQLQLRAHYLYSVTVKEFVEGSLEIFDVKELGRLGQADTEVPLINENLPQLFDYHLEMTERVQTLIDNKKYIRGQFVVREGSGEYVVQVTDQEYLLYVHERYPEHVNRAIQGSIVITERVNIHEMRHSRKEFVRVLRVDYPTRMGHMYGKLEQDY
jgi:hypothetical protein